MSALSGARGLQGAEVDREHQLVGLAFQCAQFGAGAGISQPFRVGPHFRTLGLAIACVFIDPDVHVFVWIASFGFQIT